jgi:metallophosphoesterase (TIGR03767 family)
MRTAGVLLATTIGALALTEASGASGTLDRTILDRDGDNRLEAAPGESHAVREELAPARPGREGRRRSRLFFSQMSDLHVVDEESPLRVEFLDRVGDPFTSAYRPQEAMTTQVLNEMVRATNGAVSGVSGRALQLVMTTGDNTDNTQLNETRWMIDVLDGGRVIDPDSGVQGTCGSPPDGSVYDGVRGGDYYEPDGSAGGEDGPGYSPDQAENVAAAGRSSQVRDFPGLFERANRPFRAVGLDVPWYGIFGNHDALIQGNQPRDPGLEAIATGCVKVQALSNPVAQQVGALGAGGLTAAESAQAFDLVLADMRQLAASGAAAGRIVPRDDRRRPLRKSEYIAEHFRSDGAPRGHGFTPANVASGMGNYAFDPAPGLRFVVLDSIAETGGDGGNLDDAQFRWLHRVLLSAEAARKLVMVFAHHSLETMSQAPVSGFPPGDEGGNPDPLVHYGEKPPGAPAPAPCLLTDAAAEPTPDETVRCLFLRHPSVIALVAGHEHDNRVKPYPRDAAAGGFWQIITASHVDWAQQSRLLELLDNRDGTLSIVGTVLDHAAPPSPGAAGAGPRRLASIARELSFNDPDANNGEDGRPDRRGARRDRNVELLVPEPYSGVAGQ